MLPANIQHGELGSMHRFFTAFAFEMQYGSTLMLRLKDVILHH